MLEAELVWARANATGALDAATATAAAAELAVRNLRRFMALSRDHTRDYSGTRNNYKIAAIEPDRSRINANLMNPSFINTPILIYEQQADFDQGPAQINQELSRESDAISGIQRPTQPSSLQP